MLTFPLSLIACRMPVSESKISENFLFYRTFLHKQTINYQTIMQHKYKTL